MKLISTLGVLLLAATAAAQNYSFSNFGRPCGGDLAGQVVRTQRGAALQWDVTNADAGAVAILVVGHLAATPIALPGSGCLLLVDPRTTLFQQVDGRGHAQFLMALPPVVPLQVQFQAVTVELSRMGRVAESTNGVEFRAR
ncbi:MAG: hypothetical protein IPK26_15870 [Planctomycetes bacterium]|nr:hypothetical protein [Planctomycetota bacterium]